jgi:predicted transcriptional regulator
MAVANTVTESAQANFRVEAKTRLIELGSNVTELAEELGLARNTVSIAINHPSMLPTVKNRIRRALKLS